MKDLKIDSSVPEIPPEIEARQRQSIALTPFAAESIGADTYRSDNDSREIAVDPRREAQVLAARRSQIDVLNELAKTPPGYEPCAGLSAAQTQEIMARHYLGAPPMDSFYGDLTPAFVVWMFEDHPRDAHVRYYTRLMPNLGTWMARQHPKFEYTPRVADVVPVDFGQKPTEGREIPTLAGVSAEKQKLMEEITELKKQLVEDAELKKLRAELAELKKAMNPEATPTRRPRATSPEVP